MADGSPSAGVIAKAVQQIQHGIGVEKWWPMIEELGIKAE
jgi:hypothetical protein